MNDQESQIKNFSQTWPKPSKNNPIIIIGTGGIVKDAHLPAYKKAGFNVLGLYDVDKQKAEELAKEYKIENVYESLEKAFENSFVSYKGLFGISSKSFFLTCSSMSMLFA